MSDQFLVDQFNAKDEEIASLRARLLTLEKSLEGMVALWSARATFTTDEFYAGQLAGQQHCAKQLSAALAASRGREPERT